ncbi:MAG TPA: DJ-1/PfpI family protein [Anaerolineales bacterium]
MAKNKKQIAFVVYPGVPPLDLVGTHYPLAGLRTKGYQPLVVAENLEPVDTDTPLKIFPQKTFAELPRPAGIVVMGGDLGGLQALTDEALLGYLRTAGESAEFVASVGEGSLILASAGLLKNRQGTTHWAYASILESLGVEYVPRRFVEDGKFFTAAGVTAGVDMGLYMVSKLAGAKQARFSQLWAEYDPHPPLGGINWESLDREALKPLFLPKEEQLRKIFADHPDLLQKLLQAIRQPARVDVEEHTYVQPQ